MYYLVFIMGLLLSLCCKESKKAFNIYFSALLVLAVLRYGVGPDYFSYAYLYDRIPSSFSDLTSLNYAKEFLFSAYSFACKSIGISYEIYTFIITFLNMIFIYKTCLEFSKYPVMSLFLYYSFFYFVWTFSVYRQGLTLTIGVYYLLKYLKIRSFKKLVVIAVILSLVHASSLLLIGLYLIVSIDYKKRTLIMITTISILFSLLPIGKIFISLPDFAIIERIKPYIDQTQSVIHVLEFKSLSRIIFLVIGLFFYNALKNDDSHNNYIIKIYILGMCSYFVFKFSELTASRISIYGFYLIIIILPNVYSFYKIKFDKFLFTLLLIALSSIYFIKELGNMEELSGITDKRSVVKYTSVYEKNELDFENMYFEILSKEKN